MFRARWRAPAVVVVIWVLVTAVVVVLGPVSAGFVVVIDCDVVAEQ